MLDFKQTRDDFQDPVPLLSLKLKNTLGGALILVDNTPLHIFLYFYNGLIFGV